MLTAFLLATTLLTEWGTLTCSGVRCVRDPGRGIRVYWSPPALLVTKDHRPALRRFCRRVPQEPETWDCRPGGPPGPLLPEPAGSPGGRERRPPSSP
jgi:hypothetical protein